jgi:hypothetical protein
MHFSECMHILYFMEMIMLTTEMLCLLLTHEVENISGVVRYCNKRVAS